MLCDFSCFLLFLRCSFFGVAFVEILDFLFFVFWLWRSFRLKLASNPLIFHLFFVFYDFFVFCYFCVVFFSASPSLKFLFFIFWLWRWFRLKKASNLLTFHLFFRVLRFFVFSVIFVLFFSSASPSLKFWIFYFSFLFWLWRSFFRFKKLHIPLLFISRRVF